WASDHSRALKDPWSVLGDKTQGMALNTYRWNRCLKEEQRWYRGDFHTHTQLSDGKMTPQHLLEVAAERGLDFFVTTEHNLLPTAWPHSDSILVIPGIELSSSAGHFNALGIKRWLDWRYNATDGGCESQAGINRLLKDIADDGAISSLNHSLLPPWDWRWDETLLNMIGALEIINDPTFPGNEEANEAALLAWNILWNDGYTIRGLGGSDTHLLPGESYANDDRPSLVGDPTTFVFADSLSATAILQAVSEGRIYVSRGPIIDPQFTFKGSPCYFGSDLTEIPDGDDGLLVFKIGVSKAPPAGNIILIENGNESSRQAIDGDGIFSFKLNWQNCDYRWARIEIRDSQNLLLAFSNPLFRGRKIPDLKTWGDLRSKLPNQLNH
ncbi:MAG: CehA/McbA family metallohydrolase, partial [Dethiobacteria bacterium]|nr:CehA/McbA family metallohydrolase [Dethiobacteria bacterium]